MAYWDTSCLLKLYAPEADSAVVRAYAVRGGVIVTSDLTRLELFSALCRKEWGGDVQAGGARRALAAYDADVLAGLVTVTPMGLGVVWEFEVTVEQCYRRTPPLPVRTLDAIHLATAIAAGEAEMVATDNRLREAAAGRGLTLFPPP